MVQKTSFKIGFSWACILIFCMVFSHIFNSYLTILTLFLKVFNNNNNNNCMLDSEIIYTKHLTHKQSAQEIAGLILLYRMIRNNFLSTGRQAASLTWNLVHFNITVRTTSSYKCPSKEQYIWQVQNKETAVVCYRLHLS